MTRQLLNLGSAADDGLGDSLRAGGDKINDNFAEAYAGARRFPVISRTTPTAEPGSPSDGDCYIIPDSATGTDWAGNDGKIALWSDNADDGAGAWVIEAPAEGWSAFIADEDIEATWSGSAWVSPIAVELTDGATITPDLASGRNFTVTLGGNRTLANMSNKKPGHGGLIVIAQDGTGARTLAYGSDFIFPGGAPTLSTDPLAVDVLSYFVVDATTVIAALTQDYQ